MGIAARDGPSFVVDGLTSLPSTIVLVKEKGRLDAGLGFLLVAKDQ